MSNEFFIWQLKQESTPTGNRKKPTACGVTSPGWGVPQSQPEGMPQSQLGGYPLGRTCNRTGVPPSRACDRTRVPPPPGQDLWPDCTLLERTWDQTEQENSYPDGNEFNLASRRSGIEWGGPENVESHVESEVRECQLGSNARFRGWKLLHFVCIVPLFLSLSFFKILNLHLWTYSIEICVCDVFIVLYLHKFATCICEVDLLSLVPWLIGFA